MPLSLEKDELSLCRNQTLLGQRGTHQEEAVCAVKWEVCVWVVLLPPPALLMRQSCHSLEKTMCLHG